MKSGFSENTFIVEQPSKLNFEATVDSVISEAQKREWSIPAVHDLQQSLAKAGKNVKPVKVIEICKPKYSGQMLELSNERIVSVIMPCRISVYEKDDGRVYISLLNAGVMAKGFSDNIQNIIKASSDETFEIVKVATESGVI